MNEQMEESEASIFIHITVSVVLKSDGCYLYDSEGRISGFAAGIAVNALGLVIIRAMTKH